MFLFPKGIRSPLAAEEATILVLGVAGARWEVAKLGFSIPYALEPATEMPSVPGTLFSLKISLPYFSDKILSFNEEFLGLFALKV